MLIVGLVCGLVFGLRARAHAHSSNISLDVDLGYSTYQGANGASGVSQWLGIRYAAAPIGNLRFRAPQDPVTDNKTYVANTRGPICHSSPSTSLSATNSEDCLFLNVFAPTTSRGSHPVFIYFQGGGFNTLSAPDLDGTSLISAGDHDIVVVTFNYRVGPYGFLASKEVQSDGDLNAGLLDQRKALEWIQKYIHLFGGDPTRVTIGGASAGGASVDLHMSAYGGRNDGLFHQAAAESQSFGAQLTVEESQYQYDALAKRVGCNTTDSLNCLRNVNIETIADNNPNIPTPGGSGGDPVFMYSPVIDGNFTQDYTYNAFAQGKFVKIPSIFGDDTNEGTIFTPTGINTSAQFHAFLKDNFVNLTAANLAQIDNFYPQAGQFPGKGVFWQTAANAYGDMRYICPGINISSMLSSHGVDKSWNYHWDVLEAGNAASGLGVTHTAESGSIWGSSTAPENALIPTIQGYWTSFIRTGDPNTHKISTAPTWGTFSASSMQRIHFTNDPANVAMEVVPASQQARCQYLSSIGPSLQQ
ncbi:triacylglycerol lipase-like protein [Mollisia scopiformis]|uniref:Carboxylic ester hydrolase n=1 Tax=Mollisia scopiformis TaxID=149040 RepID=A0A132BDW3_MOLSC|nr:triacylglycerol lipase-like protein [Mollisia scopiformis]KUJ10568.1 triacylglycerol lipase-like protein [Mollisia scopiformis]